jgi:hypothetical protein
MPFPFKFEPELAGAMGFRWLSGPGGDAGPRGENCKTEYLL